MEKSNLKKKRINIIVIYVLAIIISLLFVFFYNIQGIRAYLMAEAEESNYFTLQAPSTPVADITVSDYGQYVDIGTNILSKTIALEDGTTPKADWRVFSKDSNGAWIILADYMPNSSFDVTTTGLEVGTDDYATYGVRSTTSRVALINGLDHSNWSNFITGSNVAGKNGVVAKGAVDLPTWRDSWNANPGYTTLYTPQKTSAMSDGLYGYYVGDTENTTNYNFGLSSNAGYSNTLYFPHKSVVSYCTGYWLASPSADNTNAVMLVYYNSTVDGSRYSNLSYDYSRLGVRPAVYLPSYIRLNTEGEVWTIAN